MFKFLGLLCQEPINKFLWKSEHKSEKLGINWIQTNKMLCSHEGSHFQKVRNDLVWHFWYNVTWQDKGIQSTPYAVIPIYKLSTLQMLLIAISQSTAETGKPNTHFASLGMLGRPHYTVLSGPWDRSRHLLRDVGGRELYNKVDAFLLCKMSRWSWSSLNENKLAAVATVQTWGRGQRQGCDVAAVGLLGQCPHCLFLES